jgi:hypothetical protein
VPIHKPFRVGITMSSNIMEGYLNGLLVKTRQLKRQTLLPSSGSYIFAPSNIKSTTGTTTYTLSTGIYVLNVRTFGYIVDPSEMKGRMNDLVSENIFNPPLK